MKHLIILIFIFTIPFGCADKDVKRSVAEVESVPTVVPTDIPKSEYAFGGHCAEAMSTKKKKIMTDKKYTLIYKNVLYCFRSKKAQEKFQEKLDKNVEQAHRHWREIERLNNFNKNG